VTVKHERPQPIYKDGKFYAVYSDGYREELDPLTARIYAQAWNEMICGVCVKLAMKDTRL
jgi:hypothetical protein